MKWGEKLNGGEVDDEYDKFEIEEKGLIKKEKIIKMIKEYKEEEEEEGD